MTETGIRHCERYRAGRACENPRVPGYVVCLGCLERHRFAARMEAAYEQGRAQTCKMKKAG